MSKRKIANANRAFKGIWIPAEIWLDPDLTTQEMLFLVEIDSLDVSEKGCFASNSHFADFFGITASRCSQIIKSLKMKEYISVELIYGPNREVEKRVLRVVNKLNRGIKYIKEGYLENAKGSNTYLSNTKDMSSSLDEEDSRIPYKEIIDYLNEKTGKVFRFKSAANRKLIKARFNDGNTLDDFKKVIDVKTKQWLNDASMNQYLRPATLFGSKFDQYRSEYVERKPAKQPNEKKFWQELRDIYGDQ